MLNSAALKPLFDRLFYIDSDAEHMARLKDSVLGHRPTSRAHRDCAKVAHMACFGSHDRCGEQEWSSLLRSDKRQYHRRELSHRISGNEVSARNGHGKLRFTGILPS